MSLMPWRTVILTPPASEDLTLVETVKRELNIKTNVDDDLWLERIRRASAEITRFCNRPFAQAVVTDYFRPTGSSSLGSCVFVSRPPVVEVIESEEEVPTPIDWSKYTFNDHGQVELLDPSGGTPEWVANTIISITYRGGYLLLQELPREIEEACINLVKARYFGAKRDPYVVSESVPGVLSTEYRIGALGIEGSHLPPDVQAPLESYKRYVI